MIRFILLLFMLAAAALAAWLYLGPGFFGIKPKDAGGGGSNRPIYVLTEPVGQADFAVRLDAVGTAKAKESITVTAKTQDTVSAINFQDGQVVGQGFVIAEMTSRQQSAQLSEARAALSQAQAQFERTQTLAAQGLAAQSLLDQRRSERDSAEARVKQQESLVSDRLIRAPFAGVLGLRQVSVGSLVRPGDAITTLDDVSIVKVDLALPETAIALLKPGLGVSARAAGYPDKNIVGAVAGIDSRVDPQSRTVAVRAELPNADNLIKPGMLLAATLLADSRRGLMVSEAAIVPLGPNRYVYVVGANGKAERRPVKTGRRNPGQVEILEGLRLGESVVTDGVVKLRPDAPITTKPPGQGGDKGQGGGKPRGPA